MRAIDCMGFAGGFTTGVVQSGFDLIAKREMEAGFGVANCEANRHILGYNWITETCSGSEWSVPDGGAEFLFGNPPCSGFSVMSAKNFRGMNSPINHCMWAFADYAARVRPLVAVFESVRIAYTTGQPLMKDLRARLEARTGETWALYHVLHDAHALGGPAVRKRYFWVVSRIPFGVEHPILPAGATLEDTISDLSDLPLTWNAQLYNRPPTWWSESRRSPSGIVDGHMDPRTPNAKRLADLATMVGWQPGVNIVKESKRCYDTFRKLPDSWANQEERLVEKEFDFGFNATARWSYEKPARVVTGVGPAIAIHPEHDRVFTHREIARIMGFPDDWMIFPIRNVSGLPATWGKGITVDAGRWISQWVKSSIEGNPGTLVMEEVGNREYKVEVSRVRTKYDRVGDMPKIKRSVTSQKARVTAQPQKDDEVNTDVQFVSPDTTAENAKEANMTDQQNVNQTRGQGQVSMFTPPTAPTPPVAPTPPSAPTSHVTQEQTASITPQTESQGEDTAEEKPKVKKSSGTGRGRPRPEAVINRDNRVYELVKSSNGITREQIANDLNVPPKDAYSSLYRLRRDEKVYRGRDGGSHMWYVNAE